MNKLKALHFEHPEDKELNKYLSGYKLVYKHKPNSPTKKYKANFVGFLCYLDNKRVTAEPFIGENFTQIKQQVLEYLFNSRGKFDRKIKASGELISIEMEF